MCKACDAYDEILEVLRTYGLTNDQGAQLLANLILTFTGKDPAKSIILLGVVGSRVMDALIPDENETLH